LIRERSHCSIRARDDVNGKSRLFVVLEEFGMFLLHTDRDDDHEIAIVAVNGWRAVGSGGNGRERW